MVTIEEATTLVDLHKSAVKHFPKAGSIDRKLDAIEKQVAALAKRVPAATKPTWATVAAAATTTASFGSAINLPGQNNAVTIWPPQEGEGEYNGRTLMEVLEKVRTAIPGAVAAQPLRSGDIRITMASAKQKEAALSNRDHIGQALGAKVLRQDYPVEVQAVPISVPVQHGKSADNTKVIQEMIDSTKRLIPNFTATRIAWIHGENSLKPRKGEAQAPRHASLIVYVPTAELQRKAVQQGIIIKGVIYPTRLYENGLQRTRCFRCNRWGHTQSSCRAKETCGHCAGEHDTRRCPSIGDPSVARCCNCGKGGHRAWQTSKCPDYRRRHTQLEERRRALEGLSLSWRAERSQSAPLLPAGLFSSGPSATATSTYEVLAGRKRHRPDRPEASQDEGSRRRGPGRPPKVTLPDPFQSSLVSFTQPAQTQATLPVEGPIIVPATQNPWGESQSQHMEAEATQVYQSEW